MRNMPPVVRNLIIINVTMLIITMITPEFMTSTFSLFYFESPFFKPFQLLTHMFMHGGIWHLAFNMYALWMFGSVLENVWGSKKFFIYYLVTGLGAALLHLFVLWIQVSSLESSLAAGNFAASIQIQNIMRTPTVGASGAVYGLLLGFGMLFPDNVLRFIFPPIALKAKWLVIIFGAIELLLGLANTASNIAHFAHLGGMLFGYFIIIYWKKKGRLYY